MTEKLYDIDPFLRDFTAAVLSCEEAAGGYAVTLDRTAFYPEGGGQPADLGVLGDAAVTDVRNRGEDVVHICSRPLPVGGTVAGAIDWDRRFDLMQQHSGEHIVSGLICGRFGCDNVGFHIGHDLVTIDFNAELTMEQVRGIEAAANRYIWADRPVQIAWPSPEELAALSYRSKKELTGRVCIVTFPGADRCACCGTHVRSSGQVGLVKLLSVQKFREGVRIEMAAGGRAVAYCTAMLDQNTRISQLLSARPAATAQAVERLQQELRQLKNRAAALEAEDFARKAERCAGTGDVLLVEGPMSSESLRKLCAAVQETCGGRCAVFAGEGSFYQYAVGFPGGDLRAMAKALNGALNGRGGGKPAFIQGSVQAEEAAIRSFMRSWSGGPQ